MAIKKVNLEILKQEDDYLYDCVFREIEIQNKITNPNVLSIIDHHREGKIFEFRKVPIYCSTILQPGRSRIRTN